MSDPEQDHPSGFGRGFWIALIVFVVLLAAIAIAVALGGDEPGFVYEGFN